MARWRLYPLIPIEGGGRQVLGADGKPDYASPDATKVWQRWRVTGIKHPVGRQFRNTAHGRKLAKNLRALLEAAEAGAWPHDGTGWPLTPDAAQARTQKAVEDAVSRLASPPAAVQENWSVERLVDHLLETEVAKLNEPNTGRHYRTNLLFARRIMRYDADDPRGEEGESLLLAHLSTDECQRAVNLRSATNQRGGGQPRVDGYAVSVGTETHFVNVLKWMLDRGRAQVPGIGLAVGCDPMAAVATRRSGLKQRPNAAEDGERRAERLSSRDAATVEDVLAVLDHDDGLDPFFQPHVLTDIALPLRPGEIRRIDVRWFDLQTWSLRVARSLVEVPSDLNGGSPWKDGPTKWREHGDDRPLHIPDWARLREALTMWLPKARALHRQRRTYLEQQLATARQKAAADPKDARLQARVAQLERLLALHNSFIAAFPARDGSPLRSGNFNKRDWHPAVARVHGGVHHDEGASDLDAEGAGQTRAAHPLLGLAFKEVRVIAHNDLMDNAGLTAKQTADLAGNSERVVQEHYRRRTRQADADAAAKTDQRWQRFDGRPVREADQAPEPAESVDAVEMPSLRQKDLAPVFSIEEMRHRKACRNLQ